MRDREMAIGAVDIGGTKIAVAAVSETGTILAKEETPTLASRGFDAAIDSVIGMLHRVAAKAQVELSCIGIGCTGPVDPFTGEIGAVEFLPGWQGCNPVTRLSAELGIGVVMENDADAAALGEARWGTGRGRKNLICVTVGTGIGAGLLVNGTLYRGVGGAHPELGHHVIDCSGPGCFCGADGCWEVLASGPAMVKRFAREMPSGHPDRDSLSAAAICAAARQGNVDARRAVELEGFYLGVGLANLITLFAPEVIVLSGSVMDSADLFLPWINQVIRRSCGLVPASKVELAPSVLGRDAPLIGAGAVFRHRHPEAISPC